MRARRRRTSTREAEISAAVLRIAGREGIAALTMERLAREVGLTAGALFRHFPSRAAMLNGAAQHAAALLDDAFPPRDLPPLERVRLFLEARAAVAARHGQIPQLVFSAQFAKALPPKGGRAVRGIVRRSYEFLVEALSEAARRGEVRGDIPPAVLATTVLGTILTRALLAALLDADAVPADGHPGEDWQHLRDLLRPPAEDRQRPEAST